jgi:hypothetical protein
VRRRAAFACALILLVGCAVVANAADPAPASKSTLASCTTNTSGYCTVAHDLGGTVHALAVTPVIPQGGQHYSLSVVQGSVTSTAVKVRAVKPGGGAYTSAAIQFYLMATGVVEVPPPVTTTIPPTTTTAAPTTTTPVTTPPPAGTCPLPAYPAPACTGVPGDVVLAQLGGIDYIARDGEKIEGKRVNALYVQGNVTVKDSQIDTAIWVQSGSLTIEHSTIGPECGGEKWLSEGIRGSNYTAVAVKVRGHENGFSAGGQNITIRDSFVDICGHGEAHADGIQDYPGGNNIVFKHNTVDLRGEQGQNAAVNVNMGDQGLACVSNNVTIADNLLMGGGYVMTLCPTNTGWDVHGNRIVDRTWGGQDPEHIDNYKPWNVSHGCKGIWSDNDVVTIGPNYEVTSTVENDKPC